MSSRSSESTRPACAAGHTLQLSGWSAAFHRADLDEPPVVALPIIDELSQGVRPWSRLAEQLIREHDQERVVRAAGRPLGSLGIAAIRHAERFEPGGHLFRPVRRFILEQVLAPSQLHHGGQ